ncbi:REP-associated tyrosine transposase [Thioalkalivibrio thiocyanodenitrificans]|uniref:REP-associated tyrosine transposase n=1 Tax=Thioalkalivibrio thiocyanodenitrificans TaxID=243063 RepID=UPI0003609760
MNYRRARVAGATYFFTVNLADRRRSWLTDHIDLLRSTIRKVKLRHPFTIDAIVILPDHMHIIWTLPDGDQDFDIRWMLIKGAFSRGMPRIDSRNASRRAKGERGVWQRRYWEHVVRDDPDFERHVDYIHYNPVKHGLVAKPAEWPYSSIHRFIERGILPADWGGRFAPDKNEFGERRSSGC